MKKIFRNRYVIIVSIAAMLFMSACSASSNSSSTSSSTASSQASSKASTSSGNNTSSGNVNVTVDNNSANNNNANIKNVAPPNQPPVNSGTAGKSPTVNVLSKGTAAIKPGSIPAVQVANEDEFAKLIVANLSTGQDVAVNFQSSITKENYVDKAIKIVETSGYSGYVSGISTAAYNNVGYITFNYKGDKNSFLTKIAAVNAKVQQIVASQVQPNMSDYDKELALHDYLANNTNYDYNNVVSDTIPDDSFTAYGALIKGTAVCEGFAEAMYKLLSQAQMKAYIINGYGNGVPHEWNLVNINGGIYHLDPTFDTPVSTGGKVITHNYFNVNDEEISKDHNWDLTAGYPKTYAIAANYFVVNNLMADNKSK